MRASKCYVQLGKYDKATELLQQSGKATHPQIQQEVKHINELSNTLERGRKQLEDGNARLALSTLQSVLQESGDSASLRLLIARALIENTRYGDALAILSVLCNEDSNNLSALHHRGVALYYSGNSSAAAQHFSQILRLDPDNKESMRFRKLLKKLDVTKAKGNDAFKRGQYREAADHFSTALNLDPQNVDFNAQLYCNRAAALQKVGEYKQAHSDCEKAIRLKPDYLKAFVRRGNCELNMESYEEAVRSFEAALRIEPRNRELRQKVQHAKLELKKSKRKDFYKILGVPKDATSSQIKKAYRKGAVIYHPDKNASKSEEEQKKAEAMFKDIGEAYSILSDDQKRRRYDSGADLDELNGGPGSSHVDVNELFNMFFAGGGAGRSPFGGGGHGFHFG
jgi:DnaJ homolog subfamily C member 7